MSSHARKRSWRNLVLDRQYQLTFTLVLVIVCATFMGGLGYLVFREVKSATKTAMSELDTKLALAQDAEAKAPIQADIDKLNGRETLVLLLLIGLGIGLTGGLFAYGIKMTHHVAGPLFKVGSYCEKVTAGRFDTVYPLRKGDQLISFYEHFKQAHEALRRGHERDIEVLKAVVAAADAAGLPKSDELQALRDRLAQKEAAHG